jgi:cytoskeletal protein RodZ
VFEIGNSLREARERQGRTFLDLERTTQIRSRYLKALENEDFSAMPALSYTRGFLRVYADELGLDGQLYIDEFNSRFAMGEEGGAPFRRRESRPPPTRRSRRIASVAVVVTLATIALLLTLIFVAFSSRKPNQQPAGRSTTNRSTTKHTRTTTLKITAVHGDVSVEVHTGGQGGKLLFGGTLVRGHSQTFTATRLWIKVSATQNIRWTTLPGGVSINSSDRVGPATLRFTPDGHTFLSG